MNSKQTEEEKDRQVEEELQLAITIATRLFKVVSDPEFIKQVPDPRDRHEVVNLQLSKMDDQVGSQMYTQFANAYPMVLKYITQQVSFNRTAFEKFFRAQISNPGEGMEGFIEHQANYAKLLYIEASKAAGKHWSMKKANKLKQREYDQMNKIRKDIEKSRKDAENSFDQESTQHLSERKKELLDFINQEFNTHDMPGIDEQEYSGESSDDEQQETGFLSDEEWWLQATNEERLGKIKTLKFLEETLTNEVSEKESLLARLEVQVAEQQKIEKEKQEVRKKQVEASWLKGTLAEGKKNKNSNSKKKNSNRKRR